MTDDQSTVDPRVPQHRVRIGLIIRSLRLDQDLTQEDLAHLSDVSVRHLRRIEAGTLSAGIDLYIRIALALRLPLTRLFDNASTPGESTENPGAGGGEPWRNGPDLPPGRPASE